MQKLSYERTLGASNCRHQGEHGTIEASKSEKRKQVQIEGLERKFLDAARHRYQNKMKNESTPPSGRESPQESVNLSFTLHEIFYQPNDSLRQFAH